MLSKNIPMMVFSFCGSFLSLPDLNGRVATCRSNLRAIRRPCHAKDNGGMPSIGEYACSSGTIPNLDGGIDTSRNNLGAIRRPCDSVDGLSMAHIGEECFSRLRVPDLHRMISTPRSNA